MQAKKYISFMNPPVTRGIFYLSVFLLLTVQLSAQAKLRIVESKKSFGQVMKGEVVKIVFELRNEGDQPIIIESAKASCECTSAEFRKDPLLPRSTATVTVSFDTKGAYGRQDRIVELYSNAEGSPHKLRFRGTVKRN